MKEVDVSDLCHAQTHKHLGNKNSPVSSITNFYENIFCSQ